MELIDWMALKSEVENRLSLYARSCDERNWDLLDNVFSSDAVADYESWHCPDRCRIILMLKKHLMRCGPSQHLISNVHVDRFENHIQSTAAVRAIHQVNGCHGTETYEAIGNYIDQWVRGENGWIISRRRMNLLIEIGDRNILTRH